LSDFNAKMHQIRFWLGHWGRLQRSPDPYCGEALAAPALIGATELTMSRSSEIRSY